MKGIPFKGQTNVLGAPPNWNEEKDGPCEGLPVRTFQQQGGMVVRASVWQPTDEERALIAAGGNVELMVFGSNHPPVYVGAVAPEEAIAPEPNVNARGTA